MSYNLPNGVERAKEEYRRTVTCQNADLIQLDHPSWDAINLTQECIDAGDTAPREGWAVLYPNAAKLADNSPWGFLHDLKGK
jgi:hypothetical protein